MAHTLAPAHVKGGYRHTNKADRLEYRNTFIAREKIASDLMLKHMEFIKKEDPNAIVFIYGDHGFMLSAGQRFGSLTSDEERKFLVQDRHGALFSVWPEQACQKWFDQASAKGHITMTQIARALLVCLANGEDPVIGKFDNKLPFKGEKFEDYVYE